MSTENENLVRTFLSGMGPTLEAFKNTYATMMTDDVEWESVGGVPHIGRDVCVEYLDKLKADTAMEYCEIEVLNIASADDVVLTERIDTMFREDGSVIFSFRIMGTFVVRDGKIARYTDYYDSLGAAKALGRI